MDMINILLIEDNPGDARFIREMIHESPYLKAVLSHENLLSGALEKLLNDNFDLILLDLSLPDSSGLNSMKTIRESHSAIPIIVLTGLTDEEMAVEAVKNGCQDYLFKTEITAPLLSRTIRYALERKASEREREKLILELKQALDDVQNLRSFFPICANCKKIRDDKGYWNQIENYLRDNSRIDFSHTICPECKNKLYSNQ